MTRNGVALGFEMVKVVLWFAILGAVQRSSRENVVSCFSTLWLEKGALAATGLQHIRRPHTVLPEGILGTCAIDTVLWTL